MDEAPVPSPLSYWKAGLFYFLLGPALAILAYSVVLVWFAIGSPDTESGYEFIGTAIEFLAIAAYVLGGLPAALTGLSMAALTRRPGPFWLHVLSSSAIGGVLSSLPGLVIALLLFDRTVDYGEPDPTVPWAFALATGIPFGIGVVAGLVCGALSYPARFLRVARA